MIFGWNKTKVVLVVCLFFGVLGAVFSNKIVAIVVGTLNLSPTQTAVITCSAGTLRVADYGASSKELFCESNNSGGCVRSGCRSELCVEAGNEVISVCVQEATDVCYQSAPCERLGDGTCGHNLSAYHLSCIANNGCVPLPECALPESSPQCELEQLPPGLEFCAPASPQPSCTPRPGCLDALPACQLPVPPGGWCPSSSPSIIPSPSPSPSTIPSPFEPPPSIPPFEKTEGLWLSPEEIAALPTSGGGWSSVQSAANGGWGSANLGDNNASHDVHTLAGALVAAKTGDQAMRAKVISGLQSAMGSGTSRALELSRGLQSYVIAADLIGYRDPAFVSWVREIVNKGVSGHSGGSGVLGTAKKSANNWGGHARASGIAAALYLDDAAMIEDMKNAHLAFIGVSAPNEMSYTGTSWHAGSPQAGLNVKGATIDGTNVSGVLPEDWRRASGYKWLPSTSGYMWEGMQGFVVSAVLLHRAGLVPFNAGDNAVVRAMDVLYGTGEAAQNNPVYKNPASGDDTWIPWLVNHYAGTNYPTSSANAGKGMGWTDWTHQ